MRKSRAHVGNINDAAGEKGIDDSEYHKCRLLELFDKECPIVDSVVIACSDPDFCHFELQSKNNKSCYQTYAREDLNECLDTRFLFLFLSGFQRGMLGRGGTRGRERFGRWI